MKKLITLTVILFLTLSIQGQIGKEIYKKDNYSIEYPSSWKINHNIQGAIFGITSPIASPEDDFSENVNFVTQDLKGMGIDLDKYANLSKQQFLQGIPKSKIIEDKRVKKDTYEYHMVVITAFLSQRNLKLKQYYIIRDEKAYVLTFTSMESEYDNYIKIGDEILNSFKID